MQQLGSACDVRRSEVLTQNKQKRQKGLYEQDPMRSCPLKTVTCYACILPWQAVNASEINIYCPKQSHRTASMSDVADVTAQQLCLDPVAAYKPLVLQAHLLHRMCRLIQCTIHSAVSLYEQQVPLHINIVAGATKYLRHVIS